MTAPPANSAASRSGESPAPVNVALLFVDSSRGYHGSIGGPCNQWLRGSPMTDHVRSHPPVPEPSAPSADGPFERISAACRDFTCEWERGRPDLASYLSRVAKDEQPTLLRNLL